MKGKQVMRTRFGMERTLRRRRQLEIEHLERRCLLAGPYAPAAGQPGSDAIPFDDPSIIGWASQVQSYTPGSNVDPPFRNVTRALGPVDGTPGDTVSLGRGGQITLTFESPIRDGLGFDFAVFENAFNDTFLELAFVEVSSDGVHFFRFENDSLTPAPVDAFGAVDPTDVHHLAGKYRQGFGTPFDLQTLADDPNFDRMHVTHVRLIDVIGDGSQTDSDGDPIYDPFPTVESAGFDLDGVGVIHASVNNRDGVGFEDVGKQLSPGSAFHGPDPNGTPVTGPFNDAAIVGSFTSESMTFNNSYSLDFGSWNGWAYSNANNTTVPGFQNQFSSFAGSGAAGSPTFGVGFPDLGGFYQLPTITRPQGDSRLFESLMVTNTTYAALSMRDGDAFAKKFGGPTGNDPDFYRLIITGKDASGNSLGNVDVFLADYRFADPTQDYILDRWVPVDLSPIARAHALEFTVESSDVGAFGINTPAYFAVDDIVLVTPQLSLDLADASVSESSGAGATRARVSRFDADLSQPIEVSIAPVDPSIIGVPTSVTIAPGQWFAEFPIDVVDNSLVHGDRDVVIEVSADGYPTVSKTLRVIEDDARSLQVAPATLTLDEGGTASVTVTRNDADLSQAVRLNVTSASPLVAVDGIPVIAAGQRSAEITLIAPEDQIVTGTSTALITIGATGYQPGEVLVQRNENDQPQVSVISDTTVVDESAAAPWAGFEDIGVRLLPESFYNGSDEAGGFTSGGLSFNNSYDPTFGVWSGWSYSNVTDTMTAGFMNQYSAFAGSGALQSDTYAVATAFSGGVVPSITRPAGVGSGFDSIMVTNTTYAALSMSQGDAFAKKFGGPDGTDPDFFRLLIEGVDAQDRSVGTVEFFLADFRFADSTQDYIVDQWTKVDVSSLTGAVELRFSLDSSDVGAFGMNTPAYFAVDQVTLIPVTSNPVIQVQRNVTDVAEPLPVRLSSNDSSEIDVPALVTIPAGEMSVDVPLWIQDDLLDDGDQIVSVTAEATGYDSHALSFTVVDDEVAALTLTVLTPALDEASGLGRAVVHRNSADRSQSMTVQLQTDPPGQIAVSSQVTIPSGVATALVEFQPIDNAVVDGDRNVVFTASATGFQSGQASVTILDQDVPPPTLALQWNTLELDESMAYPMISFEDVGATLVEGSFENGQHLAGQFQSGPLAFNNAYDSTFGSWSGWSYSNKVDTGTPGFANQYSAWAGEGSFGSPTYAVGNAFPGFSVPSISVVDSASNLRFHSLQVTNTTYAALSMRDGDAFAKQFGGPSGEDEDFFLLKIHGLDADSNVVGTVDVYLADYRFSDPAEDYILSDWKTVDLSPLADATELTFSLESSDVGPFGMNTPAYFALDHVVMVPMDPVEAVATVTRDDVDDSAPLNVNIQVGDPSELVAPASVVIPAGQMSASFSVSSLDDAFVDGNQMVDVTVSASDHVPASSTLVVKDDDVPALTFSSSITSLNESGDGSSIQAVVHRNLADVSQPLSVSLTTESLDVVVPTTMTIPAGQRSAIVVISSLDNVVRDGDRDAVIEANPEDANGGMLKADLQVRVLDDERSELIVMESEGTTSVSELGDPDTFSVALASRPQSPVTIGVVINSEEIRVTPTELVFSPQTWNVPQTIEVRGVYDFVLEPDQQVPIGIALDTSLSDPLYHEAAPVQVDVMLLDYQSRHLQLNETDQMIQVSDRDAGQIVLSRSIDEGITLNTSALAQDLIIEPLTHTRGLVQINLGDGDDVVEARGGRFSTLDGGAGFDRLVLGIDSELDLAAFLDQRVAGFEEIAINLPSSRSVLIDLDRLEVAVPGDSHTIRIGEAQDVSIVGPIVETNVAMVGGEFAQVIQSDSLSLRVIHSRPWQNVLNPMDVDASGDVTPLDALVVVTNLASFAQPALPPIEQVEDFHGAFLDVSGDGLITPLDALQVINHMQAQVTEAEQIQDSLSRRVTVVPLSARTDEMKRDKSEVSESASVIDSGADKIATFASIVDQAVMSVVEESSSAGFDASDRSNRIEEVRSIPGTGSLSIQSDPTVEKED